ncbi:MAG: hypothetical protein HY360_24190 [Verrucomicrobia bacterium]|nr:hypothetical protein [Verrucomicrobiota bacterium]
MSILNIELCPETGIGSIVRENGHKVDLMPNEVKQLRQATGDPERLRAILADIDEKFAAALTPAEWALISARLAGPVCGRPRS